MVAVTRSSDDAILCGPDLRLCAPRAHRAPAPEVPRIGTAVYVNASCRVATVLSFYVVAIAPRACRTSVPA